MAKSKKKAKDEEEVVEEADAEEAEAEVDEEEAEVEAEEEAEAEADEDDTDAKADEDDEDKAKDDDDDSDDDDDEESVDITPPPPKPKITRTTGVLILLNWVMAVVFFACAAFDHTSRSYYTYRTLANYAQVWGLPLREEEDFKSTSIYTRPVQRLTPEQLKKAFNERNTGKSVGSDNFVAVEEEVPFYLRPSDMTEEVRTELFFGIPKPVATLEDAIEDLKSSLPGQIAAAAREVAESFATKTDGDKRAFVTKNLIIPGDPPRVKKVEDQITAATGDALNDLVKRAIVHKTLFTMAFDYAQVKALDDTLNAKKGADLDKFVADSVERRIYYDILAPINVFRPGEMIDPAKRFQIERLGDQKVTLDQMKGWLEKRLDASIAKQYLVEDAHLGEAVWKKGEPSEKARERDSIEKRKHIAFILFALSQVQKPIVGTKLLDKSVERAQVISGIYEFTNASVDYVRTMGILKQRVADTILADRQGVILTMKKGEKDETNVRTPGFIDEYESAVDRLVKIREQILTANARLADVKSQRDEFIKTHDRRAIQHKDATDRLLKARANTQKHAVELRDLQNQLHNALLDLADAGERNFEIEAQIRAIELDFIRRTQPKGGK